MAALAEISSWGRSRTVGSTLERLIPWNRDRTSMTKASGNSITVSRAGIITRAAPARSAELSTRPLR